MSKRPLELKDATVNDPFLLIAMSLLAAQIKGQLQDNRRTPSWEKSVERK